MSEQKNPTSPQNSPPPSSATNSKVSPEISKASTSSGDFTDRKIRYPNPPDLKNPDASTLKDQWRYAIKQYSRWYSQAWGSAILAGLSFFALGWIIKGANPLPSLKIDSTSTPSSSPSSSSSSDDDNK